MIGRLIDQAVGAIDPQKGLARAAARQMLAQLNERSYDAAKIDRKRGGWGRVGGSADAHSAGKLDRINGRVRDLIRNNKYADTALRQMTASAWGDGIAPIFHHDDPAIAKLAQDEWDSWAESAVSGVHDWYGHGKLSVRGLYQDGNSLTIWRAANGKPDSRLLGRPIDHLDTAKNIARTNGVRTVQGIEIDDDDVRQAYHLFRDHPSGLLTPSSHQSERIDARDVDHLFEAQEHGQQIGVSRFASRVQTLLDVADIEDARRLAEKVSACVAIVMTKPESSTSAGLATTTSGTPQAATADSGPTTVSPGMILQTAHGTNVSTLTPAPSSSGVQLIKQQLAGVAAGLVPYHALSGDVGEANYSGLRASLLTQMGMLDDDQQNTIIPLFVAPAVRRRVDVMRMKYGAEKLRGLRWTYALPVRRHADPVKDLMAEIMEIRAGLKPLTRALADRGLNSNEHFQHLQNTNDLLDQFELILETDPRRMTGSGAYQKAADAVFGPSAAS